ncbi:hypothetical protein N7541_001438 [Penicillium brevicompactum]|uniref:DUF1907 domain-containing protein n=1 Tax=Penicillium brevicompactum TaxID=5074 RepID=A0A9W9V3M6_PENBR|nr:hypothetical protein N7541_001438 [Penicillium brevicompactum]
MIVTKHPRDPPPLDELATIIQKALLSNFKTASATVVNCPDLKQAPFNLAASGLSGNPRIADIGGQQNLFPQPILDAKYSLLSLAQNMEMSPSAGFVLGAGAAPHQDLGRNAELAPNLAWRKAGNSSSFEDPDSLVIENSSRVIKVDESREPVCEHASTTNCALMINLYGSDGDTGLVLKINAKARMGGRTLLILYATVYEKRMVMTDRAQLEREWLSYHVFDAPVVCLSVMHSADPEGLGLRMEHTHCFEIDGDRKGGHYHYDIPDGDEEVEYEAYFNVASVVYRIDRPGT